MLDHFRHGTPSLFTRDGVAKTFLLSHSFVPLNCAHSCYEDIEVYVVHRVHIIFFVYRNTHYQYKALRYESNFEATKQKLRISCLTTHSQIRSDMPLNGPGSAGWVASRILAKEENSRERRSKIERYEKCCDALETQFLWVGLLKECPYGNL